MIPGPFRRFAAIDWSGAKGNRHKGIAIALWDEDRAAPLLVRPGFVWSRREVLNWVREESVAAPTLFGMDFSFAPPIIGRGAYLPGDDVPDEARGFWAYVDAVCDDADLGAASFLEQRHRRHFYFGAADGRKADYLHHRLCEQAFNATGGGKASTVYDAIGAAQVAKASFAGMRLLHHLGRDVPVWPFDFAQDRSFTEAGKGEAGSVMVEIYTRTFLRRTGGSGRKLRDLAGLDDALAMLGAGPSGLGRDPSDHESDVLVAAAGLRAIATDPAHWQPPALTPSVARTEGWTFGVL